MATAIGFTIDDINLFERPVNFRMPFRFGVVTLTRAPQLFVCVHIRLINGTTAVGMAAQLLAPKWFDKNTELSNEQNFEQLRDSVQIAQEAYLSERKPTTAWSLFANHYLHIQSTGNKVGLNSLVGSFGTAIIDAAIVDALGRISDTSFYDLARHNLLGIETNQLVPDLDGFDIAGWLASRQVRKRLFARHTVGMVDPIVQGSENLNDGLPESLVDVIKCYGHRHFKLKVSGEITADIERLTAIAGVLDDIDGDYMVSLDGNEQYENADQVLELWRKILEKTELKRLCESIEFIEQPIGRQNALSQSVVELARYRPIIIDESDADFNSFKNAIALGYQGVSSKLCKGLYKSIINAARCEQLNQTQSDGTLRYMMSAEDLSNQAGLALQQDLALANFIGVEHVERNGHHYVNGMPGAPAQEQTQFAELHSDLYRKSAPDAATHNCFLAINKGQMSVESLDCPGFATRVHPVQGKNEIDREV